MAFLTCVCHICGDCVDLDRNLHGQRDSDDHTKRPSSYSFMVGNVLSPGRVSGNPGETIRYHQKRNMSDGAFGEDVDE